MKPAPTEALVMGVLMLIGHTELSSLPMGVTLSPFVELSDQVEPGVFS